MQFIKSEDLEQLNFAATNYKLTQQYGLAEESYRKIIMLEENLFGPATSTVALGYYNLAEVVVHQQRFAEASELVKTAVQIWEKAHPNDYLSLLSYTEAVNIVSRQAETPVVVATPEPENSFTAPQSIPGIGGSVLPMRRRVASAAVHVA